MSSRDELDERHRQRFALPSCVQLEGQACNKVRRTVQFFGSTIHDISFDAAESAAMMNEARFRMVPVAGQWEFAWPSGLVFKFQAAADRSIKFHSKLEGEPKVLHPVVREEAYRIGAEAVVNAFNHARASSIELEIRYKTAALCLLVRDDGIGIEEGALAKSGRAGHFGLVGMRERAAKMSGRIEIFTRPDVGTEVHLRIPATMAYRSRTLDKSRSWLARIFRADPGTE